MLTLPFTRRRVAPPALPARHPRRCRKCGGLVVPDRSRRYGGFARPDLVDAMGFQIKPGSGFQIKPGLGFEYADSTKPCCCAGCGCSTCSGSQVTCVTAVLSGVTSNTCGCKRDANGDYTITPDSDINQTIQLTCPGKVFGLSLGPSGCPFAMSSYSVSPATDPCNWSNHAGVDVERCDIVSAFTRQAYFVVKGGSTTVTAVVYFPNIGFNPETVFAVAFYGTATTTLANSCSFATSVTVNNQITGGASCVDIHGAVCTPAWTGGSLTISGGC